MRVRVTGWRLAVGAVLVVATVLLTVAGVRRFSPGSPEPRLVLLYAPCSVNRSFLSPYNPSVSYTPHIDAFARDGLVFTKHHTEEGQSTIAYASLFSGTHAMRHGVYVNPTRLSDDLYLIGEAYRDNGYETYFWADHAMASPELNFAQGIEPANTFWNEDRFRGPYPLRGNDPRFQQILARLKTDPDYKAFVVTNFTVTHWPYHDRYVQEFCRVYPQECRTLSEHDVRWGKQLLRKDSFGWVYAFETAVSAHGLTPDQVDRLSQVAELLYKSTISSLDGLFGEVIKEIDAHGLAAQSLVAFTADHGEFLNRPNLPLKWSHGYFLTADDIQVPLILRGPSVRPGRYEAVTRSIDVFPTLAGLSGLRLAQDTMGHDLTLAVRDGNPAPSLVAFSHSALILPSHVWSPTIFERFPKKDPSVIWVAAREGDLVYKITSEDGTTFAPHVYEWMTDPAEQHDLYDESNHGAMIKRLAEYKTALSEAYSYWEAVAEGRLPTKRQEELLRSLGYME